MATTIELEGYKKVDFPITNVPCVRIEHDETESPDCGYITITLPSNVISFLRVSPTVKKTKIEEIHITMENDEVVKLNIGTIKAKDPGDVIDSIAKLLCDPTPALDNDRYRHSYRDVDGFFHLRRRYYHGPINDLNRLRKNHQKRYQRDSTSESDIKIECVKVSRSGDECLTAICTAISVMYDHPDIKWTKHRNPHIYYPYRTRAGFVVKVMKVLEIARAYEISDEFQEQIVDLIGSVVRSCTKGNNVFDEDDDDEFMY